jgi:hypothetical protein
LSDLLLGRVAPHLQDGVVRLAPQLKSDQIAKALEGVQGTKILTLQNAAAAFSEFSSNDVGRSIVRPIVGCGGAA